MTAQHSPGPAFSVTRGIRHRGVYSSKISKLFPSGKHHLPNPSPTSKLQVPPNRTRDIDPFFDIFCDDSVGRDNAKCPLGPTEEVSEGVKLKNFVFLKLGSCNLMNTFEHKFRADSEQKTDL